MSNISAKIIIGRCGECSMLNLTLKTIHGTNIALLPNHQCKCNKTTPERIFDVTRDDMRKFAKILRLSSARSS